MYQTIYDLATQAIVPVVLSLWIAVIGGAIIWLGHGALDEFQVHYS